MPVLLVLAETVDRKVTDRSLRLLSAARALAGAGGRVAAVIVGDAVPGEGLGGIDSVYLVRRSAPAASDVVIAAILEASRGFGPDLILVPNSIGGIDVAGAVAIRSGRPLVAYCNRIAFEGGSLVARSEMFGGRAEAEVLCPLPAVAIASLTPPDAAPPEPGSAAEIVEIELPAGAPPRIAVEALEPGAQTGVDITAAERIVCVGRGIGEHENVALARELAEAFGAELAASRPLVDLGWVAKERQVGKSGRTVKPKVYLGLGVSGASEHLEGMRDSALIVAVNTNPSAPIFEVARWGTTADALELIPALTEKLRVAKG